MAATVSQFEATPAEYPTEGDDHLWQRIEAWCAHRWTPRGVVWIVDGPGDWRPPLAPVVLLPAEVWQAGAYEPVTLEETPLGGLRLPLHGPYRITGTAGADNPAPPAVQEAFERLKSYLDADPGTPPGVSSYSVNLGQISESIRRPATWQARALEMSGAADLLRAYRRAG